jgi:hypothetical protein
MKLVYGIDLALKIVLDWPGNYRLRIHLNFRLNKACVLDWIGLEIVACVLD